MSSVQQKGKFSSLIIFSQSYEKLFLIDNKMLQAAAIARAYAAGQETPDCDPRKQADRENEGRLSGEQFTIVETPVFLINPRFLPKK